MEAPRSATLALELQLRCALAALMRGGCGGLGTCLTHMKRFVRTCRASASVLIFSRAHSRWRQALEPPRRATGPQLRCAFAACACERSIGKKARLSHTKLSLRSCRPLTIRLCLYMRALQAEGSVGAAKMCSSSSRAAAQVCACSFRVCARRVGKSSGKRNGQCAHVEPSSSVHACTHTRFRRKERLEPPRCAVPTLELQPRCALAAFVCVCL